MLHKPVVYRMYRMFRNNEAKVEKFRDRFATRLVALSRRFLSVQIDDVLGIISGSKLQKAVAELLS